MQEVPYVPGRVLGVGCSSSLGGEPKHTAYISLAASTCPARCGSWLLLVPLLCVNLRLRPGSCLMKCVYGSTCALPVLRLRHMWRLATCSHAAMSAAARAWCHQASQALQAVRQGC